jgi:hypothetical protein
VFCFEWSYYFPPFGEKVSNIFSYVPLSTVFGEGWCGLPKSDLAEATLRKGEFVFFVVNTDWKISA